MLNKSFLYFLVKLYSSIIKNYQLSKSLTNFFQHNLFYLGQVYSNHNYNYFISPTPREVIDLNFIKFFQLYSKHGLLSKKKLVFKLFRKYINKRIFFLPLFSLSRKSFNKSLYLVSSSPTNLFKQIYYNHLYMKGRLYRRACLLLKAKNFYYEKIRKVSIEDEGLINLRRKINRALAVDAFIITHKKLSHFISNHERILKDKPIVSRFRNLLYARYMVAVMRDLRTRKKKARRFMRYKPRLARKIHGFRLRSRKRRLKTAYKKKNQVFPKFVLRKGVQTPSMQLMRPIYRLQKLVRPYLKKRRKMSNLHIYKNILRLVSDKDKHKLYFRKRYYLMFKKKRSNFYYTVTNHKGEVIFYFSSGRVQKRVLRTRSRKVRASFFNLPKLTNFVCRALKKRKIKRLHTVFRPHWMRRGQYRKMISVFLTRKIRVKRGVLGAKTSHGHPNKTKKIRRL